MKDGLWAADLPEGWSVRPLWSEFRRGKTLGDGTEELLSVYRDYGVIRKSSRDDNHNKASEDLSKYQRVSVGDLVVNKMKAWQGSLGISNYEGIVSPAYFVYKTSGGMERRFAHYLLRCKEYADHMGAISSGIRPNQWDLDPMQFAVTTLLVPPFGVQRAIADYLDRETAQIDAFIAKNEELIALLTERRMSMIRDATTLGIRKNVAVVDSGTEGAGCIATHWRMMRLSWLFRTTASGTTPSAEVMLEGQDADFWWVTTGELREHLIQSTSRGINADTLASTSALKVHPEGSLLIAMYGATIGRLGILGVPAASNQAVCALANPVGCSVEFVQFALLAARERLLLEAVGGGQPNINQETVRAFRIPVPPLAEQTEIVEDLERRVMDINRAIGVTERGIALARERRAALISAAVTGKIDVREAA